MVSQIKKQGRPKSEEKSRLILQAASRLFLKDGFAKTSMDGIAKASGVSKQTVYSHFDSKDVLFQSAISSKCRAYQLDTPETFESAPHESNITECLHKIGRQYIRLIQDPETVGIFRVIIAEAVNNAHVASLFYQAGPKRSLDALGHTIWQLGKGDISQEKANQLAIDYCALLKGEFHTMLLCGIHPAMNDTHINEHVGQAAEKIAVLFTHYRNK
jgi:TetR/AcrR family transcriptional repressor of mexJK operon